MRDTSNLTHLDNMTVADIRKALAHLRRMWAAHNTIQPIYTCTELIHGVSTAEFCFHFVMSHHAKRHQKVR